MWCNKPDQSCRRRVYGVDPARIKAHELERRDGVGVAKRTVLLVRRDPAWAEDALHQGTRATRSHITKRGQAMGFLCLPALLDTVIDKSHETRGNDDTVAC